MFDLGTLLRILPEAQCVGLVGNETFDILNVAHLKQFESLSYNRMLYFCVYEDDPKQQGWYNNPFDRSLKTRESGQDDKVVFVVDSRVSDDQIKATRYIRVGNIYHAIDRIRQHVVSEVSPQVIGVTGSVGKTTTAALIQWVLGKKFSCGRIYSKRLTPLTLSSWLVNFLEPTHKVLVLEYSMYRKNHIDVLTDILRPDIGVFLNVKKVHLGVNGINTLNDIVEGKRALIGKSRLGLINLDDPLVSSLKRRGNLGFSLIDTEADVHLSSVGGEAVLTVNYAGRLRVGFVPYIKTKLFYYQASVAGALGLCMGIHPDLVKKALETFRPAENRINWINLCGQNMLFDADVTDSGRMRSLAEHDYTSSILMIHSFDFGEENVDLQVDDFNNVFSMFTETRVLYNEENRTIVSRYSLENVIFVEKKDFLLNLSGFEFKILHFGTYFRKYKDLSSLSLLL